MNTRINVSPENVIAIAQAIGRCDFRTTISMYTASRNNPWVITVGESGWQRHLVVESDGDGDIMNATLAVLHTSESDQYGYDIRTGEIQKRIQLGKLVGNLGNKYIGVKKVLYPSNRSLD